MLKPIRIAPTLLIALIALAATGCGSSARTANKLRPPLPIQLNASLMPKRILISPSQIGGGPVTLIVANLSGIDQKVTFGANTPTDLTDPKLDSQSRMIAANNTATIKADLKDGTYSLAVEGDTIPAALLSVNGERPSSQNDLMLP